MNVIATLYSIDFKVAIVCDVVIQELSYRKQIARQMHTKFVEGIYRSDYAWPWNLGLGSLKVTGNGTIGYITHDLLLVELFDVKYYRDLEMWVRGHWRSLKMVPFESSVWFPIHLP